MHPSASIAACSGADGAAGETSAGAVAGWLAAFAACWAWFGAWLAAGRALPGDVVEAYVWGIEFRLGYNHHPPFWAWIAGLWFEVFPHAGWSFAVLASLNAAVGLAGAWRLAGLFAGGWERRAAVLLLLATPFYTFLSFKYNANTIFLSIWPWALFAFLRSLDQLRIRSAILFGVILGAAFLSKYYALVLLLTCLLACCVHENRARYVRSALPWVSLGVCGLLVLPHAVWAVENRAPPVAYIVAKTGRGLLFALVNNLDFVVSAALYHCVVVGLILFSLRAGPLAILQRGRLRGGLAAMTRTGRSRVLAVMTAAPPLLTVAFEPSSNSRFRRT